MAVCDRRSSRRRRLRMLLLAGAFSVFTGWSGSSNECQAQQQQFTSQWTLTNTPLNVDLQNGRQKFDMVVNTSRELIADKSFRRVVIHNQEMLTAIPLEGGNRLQISAKKTGVTQVDLVAANDSVSTLEVMVLGDVRELEAILRKTLPDATFELTPLSQGVIVTGHVSNAEDVSTITQIAQQYFPTVINRVTVMGVHTIQLQTQIMEVSRTKLRSLGIDWALTTGSDSVVSNVAGSLTTSTTGAITTPVSTPFSFSVVDNGTRFQSAIDALRRNNLVKVLATPTLTAVDGRPASFNSGGEIPIVVPAGLGQVGIQFREFGTRLDYVAKVLGNGKIYLEVRPYVSEIDPSRSVTIQNVSVPGIRSRFLETGVELQAGQTLALAGLLQVRTEAISQGLPGLSEVPFFGAFFRRSREEQNEVELLITVTPDFAGPMEPQQVPYSVPGIHSVSPTDRELFFKGYMEVPATGGPNCPPPMGMLEGVPSGTQAGIVQQPPVPRPSAMSIGPNAPTLAETNYRLPPQPSPQTAVNPNQGTYR